MIAAGASANGSPYSPGLVYGWNGVGAGDGIRYVAFGMPKSTIVAAVRARDGRVLRSKVVRGEYGVPLVAYDGTSGGLSGDGKSLVLGSYGPCRASPERRASSFSTRGRWLRAARSSSAAPGRSTPSHPTPECSTSRSTCVPATSRSIAFARTTPARAACARAIVDRLEGEKEMGGQPVARASSRTGRWAYTLYARRGDEPFVHALDTVKREAFCIDLPLHLGYGRQWWLSLGLAAPAITVCAPRPPRGRRRRHENAGG